MNLEEIKEKYPPYIKKTGNRFKDLTNLHIGSVLFLYRTSYNPLNKTKPNWVCLCDCGTIFTAYRSYSDCFSNGKERQFSCGCYKKYKDLTGKKFGELIVIRKATLQEVQDKNRELNRCFWICECSCGKEIITDTSSLLRGK